MFSLFSFLWHFFWFHNNREITKDLFTLAENNSAQENFHALARNFICANEMGSPGQAISLYLARSDSQSEHRIHLTLPARCACHIINNSNSLSLNGLRVNSPWPQTLTTDYPKVCISMPVVQMEGWCMVTWLPNFLGWVVYHIFLPRELRCGQELRYQTTMHFVVTTTATKTQFFLHNWRVNNFMQQIGLQPG